MVLESCKRIGLFEKEVQIVSDFFWDLKYGYPVPTLDRDEIIDEISNILEKFGIRSRGRFGGWKYEHSNQDYCLELSLKEANQFNIQKN